MEDEIGKAWISREILRRGVTPMEDEIGKERIRRHHRRLLSESAHMVSADGCSNLAGDINVANDESPPALVRIHSLKSMFKRGEGPNVRLLDGPNKYIYTTLGKRDYDHGPVVTTSIFPISRYPLLRSKKALGLQIGSRNGNFGQNGFRHKISGADVRMFVCAGFTVLLKVTGLLIAKTTCGQIWPYLQVMSLCTLSLDSLTFLVPKVQNFCLAPLQGLVAPVLGLTVARPLVRWVLPDAYRTGRFWRRLLPIYFGYMRTKYQVRGKDQEESQKLWAIRHEWGGEKVQRLVLDLSGFYVKSAQILATKADFVPEPWIRRLTPLLDSAPPRPFKQVKRSIQKQLQRTPWGSILQVDANSLVPLDTVFLDVEETCIAAASIAQVHGAQLKDGKRVVIKVQHLGMEIIMKSDLRNIVWVAKFLEGQLPFDLGPVVREIQKTIPLEFNFDREVWFMKTIKRNLENGGFGRIVCPEPVKELCATRLLVMEIRLFGLLPVGLKLYKF